MRAVLVEVPESMLTERRTLGLDGRDETYEKIDFYAGFGAREMLIAHPQGRWVELLRAVGGRLLPVTADTESAVRSDVLGAQFATVAGRLRITWEDGVAEL